MTDEQLLRRFRDVLECSTHPMVRGGALGVAIGVEMAGAADIVGYLDELTRVWREVKLEAQLT